MQIAHQAAGYGIKPIISSTFETSVGITTLAHLASCLKGVKYTGLDTLKWFERDLVKKINVHSGKMLVKGLPLKLSDLASNELKEVH
jgi:O-succinylbenzoate synthase